MRFPIVSFIGYMQYTMADGGMVMDENAGGGTGL